MRDCKRCIYARTPDNPNNNGCTAWECEFIDRKEAIEVWEAYKKGELVWKEPKGE